MQFLRRAHICVICLYLCIFVYGSCCLIICPIAIAYSMGQIIQEA